MNFQRTDGEREQSTKYAQCGKIKKITLTERFYVKSTLTVFSRNFFQKSVRVNFDNFHNVHYKLWPDSSSSDCQKKLFANEGAQFGFSRIFLSLRFYVKSSLFTEIKA